MILRCAVRSRRGVTLLEVVVALALMGSVLVTSLLAFTRHREQLALAENRLEATVIADRMLADWSAQRGGVPVGASGVVPGRPRWSWDTRVIGTTRLATVAMQVIRFEIYQRDARDIALVDVEFVQAVQP